MTMTAARLGDKLVLASHNKGKLAEFGELLAPYGVEVIPASALDLPEPEETGVTFRENAALKAHAAARAAGLVALSDDSGLAVTALGGEPGIYSARWAGPEKDFAAAMQRVEAGLRGQTDRSARFVCCLCVAWPDGAELVVEGEITGDLVWPPRGSGGFGYDPMFQPEGESETFGEIPPAKKHALSHRARAVAKLRALLLDGPA